MPDRYTPKKRIYWSGAIWKFRAFNNLSAMEAHFPLEASHHLRRNLKDNKQF
jgi:hypothetical protein